MSVSSFAGVSGKGVLTKLVTRIDRRYLSVSVLPLLATAKLLRLRPKLDKIRPKYVKSDLRRTFTKTLLLGATDTSLDFLGPFQKADSIKGGMDAAIHDIRTPLRHIFVLRMLTRPSLTPVTLKTALISSQSFFNSPHSLLLWFAS